MSSKATSPMSTENLVRYCEFADHSLGMDIYTDSYRRFKACAKANAKYVPPVVFNVHETIQGIIKNMREGKHDDALEHIEPSWNTEKVYELRRMMAETLAGVIDESERKEAPLSVGSLDHAFNNLIRRNLLGANRTLIMVECRKLVYPNLVSTHTAYFNQALIAGMYLSIKNEVLLPEFDVLVDCLETVAAYMATKYVDADDVNDYSILCGCIFKTPCNVESITIDALREGAIKAFEAL